ncbi:MAG: hypothetical protein ABJA79_11645 [Parafilimonas sp.]
MKIKNIAADKYFYTNCIFKLIQIFWYNADVVAVYPDTSRNNRY